MFDRTNRPPARPPRRRLVARRARDAHRAARPAAAALQARALRGFDRTEVVAFLTEAADDYEHALREIDRLRQDIVAHGSAARRAPRARGQPAQHAAHRAAARRRDQGVGADRSEADHPRGAGRADLLLQKAQGRLEEIERDINELRLRRRDVEGSLEGSIQALYRALEFIREQDSAPTTRCCSIVRGRPTPRPRPARHAVAELESRGTDERRRRARPNAEAPQRPKSRSSSRHLPAADHLRRPGAAPRAGAGTARNHRRRRAGDRRRPDRPSRARRPSSIAARPCRLTRRVIDASALLRRPGFVDAHTHAVFAGDRRDELRRRLAGETYASIAAGGRRHRLDRGRHARGARGPRSSPSPHPPRRDARLRHHDLRSQERLRPRRRVGAEDAARDSALATTTRSTSCRRSWARTRSRVEYRGRRERLRRARRRSR